MLARIVPDAAALLLWAVPAAALCLGAVARRAARSPVPMAWLRSRASWPALYGVVLVGGAALGGTDPLAPLPLQRRSQARELAFRTIKSLADLDREVAQAQAGGKA